MEVFLQRPLIFFLIGGVGCGIITVLGLIDAVRLWRARTRLDPATASGSDSMTDVEVDADSDSQTQPVSHPNLRFAGSLVLLAALAYFTVQLFAGVVRMTPALLEMNHQIGEPLKPVAYARIGDGEPVAESLARFRGQVLLVNVWATWCPPCRKEMPHLDRLQADLGSRGLQVVHLSQEDRGKLESWLAENPMSTRHGRVDSLGALPFPVPALPTSIVVDREGLVREVLVGGQSYRAFEKAITPWL